MVLAVYLIERTRPLLLRFIGAQELRAKQPLPASPLPADLQMAASDYRDQWARADAEKRFRELYEELGGDWDRVRAASGVN